MQAHRRRARSSSVPRCCSAAIEMGRPAGFRPGRRHFVVRHRRRRALGAGGDLAVSGRIDDVITTGAEKVWPDVVERVLSAHPDVAEVAVWKRSDPDWGERVVAWVVPTDDAPSLDELRKVVADTIAPWAAPKELVIVDDLPRTASGKVRRRAVVLTLRVEASAMLRGRCAQPSKFVGVADRRAPRRCGPRGCRAPTRRRTVPSSTNTVAGCPLRTTARGQPWTFLATFTRKRDAAVRADHRPQGGPDLAAAVRPDHDVLRQHGQQPRRGRPSHTRRGSGR